MCIPAWRILCPQIQLRLLGSVSLWCLSLSFGACAPCAEDELASTTLDPFTSYGAGGRAALRQSGDSSSSISSRKSSKKKKPQPQPEGMWYQDWWRQRSRQFIDCACCLQTRTVGFGFRPPPVVRPPALIRIHAPVNNCVGSMPIVPNAMSRSQVVLIGRRIDLRCNVGWATSRGSSFCMVDLFVPLANSRGVLPRMAWTFAASGF